MIKMEKNLPSNMCKSSVKVSREQYILNVTATSYHDPYIALGLSNNICHFYKLTDTDCIQLESLKEHSDTLIGCKFSSNNENLLYTGSCDGSIKIWDIRTPAKSTATFRDSTVVNSKNKTFSCFDISTNDRLLTVGTELVGLDAFIMFWDIRNKKLLGAYWESHKNDITQVKFHSDDMNKLISGSIDGLINKYDLSQNCEDDALIDTLNTESSVEQLLWYNNGRKWSISCITYLADLQLWNLEDAEPYKHFKRPDLVELIEGHNEAGYMYVANHQAKTSLLLLVGSKDYQEEECVWGLHIKNKEVYPAFKLTNKQRLRCSWYNENTTLLLTGGENGILDIWQIKREL